MDTSKFLASATKRIKKNAEVAEVDIEGAYVKHCKNVRCKAYKLIILNRRGFPDRTTLCPGGRILFIEFKRKGKKPSSNQVIVRGILESFGFEYHVCDQLGQAESILDDFLAF